MKPLNTVFPMQRFCVRSSFLVVVLLLAVLGNSARISGQGCTNVGFLAPGGQYCISATSSSGNNPQMPVLKYFGPASVCDTATYTLELDFAQPGDSYGNGQSYGLYQATLAGNALWVVDWSLNAGDPGQYLEGGNGWLGIALDGADYDGFAFYVWGQNPTVNSITSVLGTLNPPWWYGHALTWETLAANPKGGGNVQFYGPAQFDPTGTWVGTPVFGGPDGFGLSQLDGSPRANPGLVTDNSLWTWTTNLMYGVQVANNMQTSGASYWAAQLSQAQALAAKNQVALSTYYPNPFSSTYCNFTPMGAGNNAYNNGFGIAGYNAGPAGDNNAFASVNPTMGTWVYNWSYTSSVCGQQSHTMPQ